MKKIKELKLSKLIHELILLQEQVGDIDPIVKSEDTDHYVTNVGFVEFSEFNGEKVIIIVSE